MTTILRRALVFLCDGQGKNGRSKRAWERLDDEDGGRKVGMIIHALLIKVDCWC